MFPRIHFFWLDKQKKNVISTELNYLLKDDSKLFVWYLSNQLISLVFAQGTIKVSSHLKSYKCIYSNGKVNINRFYMVSHDILYLMKLKYKWQYTLFRKLKKPWKFAHYCNRQSFLSWHSYVFICSNALCVINRSNDLNIIIIPQIMDLNSTTVF